MNAARAAAVVLLFTLAFAAVAGVAMVERAVVLDGAPYRDPGRLVLLDGTFAERGEVKAWRASQLDFADWRRRNTVFEDMSLYAPLAFNLEQARRSRRLWGELVDDSYLAVLGLAPQLGRFFTAEEDARPLERYVVVIGDGLWRSSFGADPGLVGRTLQLNGTAYQVVGVAPPGFHGVSGLAELWVPSTLPPAREYLTVRRMRWVGGVARLKPAVSPAQAQAQMSGIAAALAREFPDMDSGVGVRVTSLKESWFGPLRRGLAQVFVAAGWALALACVDVALLLRAWAGGRRLWLWSLAAALGSAFAGCLLARWITPVLLAAGSIALPPFVHVALNLEVAAAVAGVAGACGLVCAGAARWLARPGSGRRWWRGAAAIAQVSLAVVLIARSGLSAARFQALVNTDLGFRRQGLLTWRVDLQGPRYGADWRVCKLIDEQYLPRLASLPGVQALALANPTLPADDWAAGSITAEDHASDAPDGTYMATMHAVTPGYFTMLGVPILAGRGFFSSDVRSNAVVISRAMAEQQWPGKNPLGKRLKLDTREVYRKPWLTVIGVVADVRWQGVQAEKPPAPDIYLSLLQFPLRLPLTVNFLVRPRLGTVPDELRGRLHQEMMAIAPDLPDYDSATLDERLARQTDPARLRLLLIGLFTAVATTLAVVATASLVDGTDATARPIP
jgi:putative ABC transport system permease protein